MSNIVHLNNVTYFNIPKHLVTLGGYKELAGSGVKLYSYICYLVQEKSKATVFISALELEAVVGMSKGSVQAARAALEESGLIKFKRSSSGYFYTLVNMDTGKPMVNSLKGEYEVLDFNDLSCSQLMTYYKHPLRGPVKTTENGVIGCCPFHDDSTPSLAINLTNGSVWHCPACAFGGRLVDFEVKVAQNKGDTISTKEAHRRIRGVLVSTGAIDSTLGPPEAVYPYHDVDGNVLFEVLRFEGKKFKQRRRDPDKPGHYIWNITGIQRILYGLPKVKAATTVIICEGERDCDNLRLLLAGEDSIAVTTCPMGAARWQTSYSQALKGKRIVIFPDQDYAGKRHGRNVEGALKGIASEVRVRNFPTGFKDMTDYLGEHDLGDLALLVGGDWISVPVPI